MAIGDLIGVGSGIRAVVVWVRDRGAPLGDGVAVLLQKSKSAIFDGCNPLKYRDTILDKSVKNRFLQQNPMRCVALWLRGNRAGDGWHLVALVTTDAVG